MSKDVCRRDYECKGDCWINIKYYMALWEIISKKCKGTKET